MRLVGACYLLALAIAVALAAFTIGTILSTALLVGPGGDRAAADTQPRQGDRRSPALIGVGSTWLGILMAYDSYDWPPLGQRLAGQLLRRLADLRRLPARGPAPRPLAPQRAQLRSRRAEPMFSGFMVNAWTVGTIVAVVAGVVGFFTVLRGSAFVAHAIPNGSLRRSRRREPDRRQHAARLRRVRRRSARSGSACWAAAAATTWRPP